MRAYGNISYDTVFNNIFPDINSTNIRFFINSVTMQRRRKLSADGQGYYVDMPAYVDDSVVPDWLINYAEIGPYEKNILAKILKSTKNHLFLSGGIKSGKTSLLKRLTHYTSNQLTSVLNDDKQTIIPEFVHFFYVDMSGKIVQEQNSYTDTELRPYFQKLASMLLGQIFALKNQLGHDILDVCFDAYTSGYDELEGDIISDLMQKLSGFSDDFLKNYKQKTANEKKKAIRDLVTHIDDNCEKIMAAMVPLWYWLRHEFFSSGHFIVVIDNIDPQPVEFQKVLAESIRSISEANSFKLVNLTIVVPLRLSTYKRRVNQYGPYNSIEHEGLFPSDYLAYRILHFLLYPESFLKGSVNSEGNKRIYLKVLLFWLELNRPMSYFSNTIDSICGTNLNHAKQLALQWCLSKKSNFFGENEISLERHRQRLKRIAAFSTLRQCWRSNLNCLRASLEINFERMGGMKNIAGDGFKPYIESCAETYAELLGEFFRDAKILCHPAAQSTICARRAIAKHVAPKISGILEKQIEKKSYLLERHAIDILNLISKYCDKNNLQQFASIFKNEFQKHSVAAMKRSCAKYGGTDIKLLKNLNEWLKLVLISSTQVSHNNLNKIVPDFEGKSYDTSFYSLNKKNNGVPLSRYDSTWTLYEPGNIILPESYGSKISPENIYALRGRLSTLPLTILFALYYEKKLDITGDKISVAEMEYQKIKEVCSLFMYDEPDINYVISRMIKIEKRLIYSDVNDYSKQIGIILNNLDTVFTLSTTGKAYMRHLIQTPTYLLWCFSQDDNPNVVNQKMNSQIKYVFNKIKWMCRYDEKILINEFVNMYKDDKFYIAPPYISPALNIMIKAQKYYIPSLEKHIKNLRDRDQIYLAECLIAAFILKAKEKVDNYFRLFGIDDRSWESLKEKPHPRVVDTLLDWRYYVASLEYDFIDKKQRNLTNISKYDEVVKLMKDPEVRINNLSL